MTRIPSVKNPFQIPAELVGFPLMYRALIRPIREADYREGKQFVQRFLNGPQETYEFIANMIASVWDVQDAELCPDDLLQYLKDIVGFDREYNYLTDRLSYEDLRKLIRLAVPLWKERFSSLGIVNLIRLLTGRNAVLYDWFHWRAILGEIILGEEQQGYDFWVIGGIVSYFDEYYMQIRLMDDGTLDEQLVLDLLSLERVSSERFEVALVDFLDQYDLTRVKWDNLATPLGEITLDKTFLLQSGTREQAIMLTTKLDYVAMTLFKLDTTGVFYLYFYVKNWAGGDYYLITVSKNFLQLTRYNGATPTILATPTLPFPISEDLWYKLRVSCVEEGGAGAKRIKIYIDGNNAVNLLDSTVQPDEGDMVLGAGAANVEVDNTELYRVPLRIAEIGPDGVTTSPNFIE